MDKIVTFLVIFKDATVSIGRWIQHHSAFVSAAATVVIAAFTLTLWWATRRLWKVSQEQSKHMETSIAVAEKAADAAKKSANVAEDTLTSTQRAFIFLKDIDLIQTRNLGDYKNIKWEFLPRWQNSGDTATRNLTVSVACQIRSDDLPDNFDFEYSYIDKELPHERGFPYVRPQRDIPLMIGPKAEILSKPLTLITSTDVSDFIKKGHIFIYIWGEARYSDIFNETPQHITCFCVRLSFVNPPDATVPLIFPIYYGEYNCADEDCDKQS